MKFFKNPHNLLILILLGGLFFRLFNAEKWFDFGHDGDLYSWIFKDIVVDHHLRLIGQITSTPGIFIGPLFYYAVIPFFFLTKLEPTGTIYLATILGVLTILSFYYIFTKLFNKTAGLIGAFLHAFLIQRVFYDRWVVPTVTTSIWEIWYFYTVAMLVRGKYQVFPLLGLLVGLIWHINFALAPALLAVPFALFFSKKWPTLKNIFQGFLGFIIPSVPLLVFEMRHGFSQTQSFITQFGAEQLEPGGISKFFHVLSQVSGNTWQLFIATERGSEVGRTTFFIMILLLGIFLAAKRIISKRLLAVLYIWVLGMFIFFSSSSKIISEYYFTNINTVTLSIVTLGLAYIVKTSWIGRIGVSVLLVLLGVWGVHYMAVGYNYNKLGYQERKAVVKFIVEDAKAHNYPCIAISYIAKTGQAVGFRYLFYLENLHVNKYSSGSPIYSIVTPVSYFTKDPRQVYFGAYGVIPEGTTKSSEELKATCQGENLNLTESMLEFTE